MTKWIDCLKEYNRNKRVWCTPRKGTRSYAKVMQCVSGDKNAFVKKKKFKIVEKFEDEKARDIQENPDIVVQMKRATINDVPDAVMNDVMGQFLNVKDKANLASVGIKVKLTDDEEEKKQKINRIKLIHRVWDKIVKINNEYIRNPVENRSEILTKYNKINQEHEYSLKKLGNELLSLTLTNISGAQFNQDFMSGKFYIGVSWDYPPFEVEAFNNKNQFNYDDLKDNILIKPFSKNKELLELLNRPPANFNTDFKKDYDKEMEDKMKKKEAKDKKPKVVKKVKSKKPKVVKKVEDEKARDIQENPDLVVQMKRATINDVPDAVMNNIMGQFLDVKDKAKFNQVSKNLNINYSEKEKNKGFYKQLDNLIDNYREQTPFAFISSLDNINNLAGNYPQVDKVIGQYYKKYGETRKKQEKNIIKYIKNKKLNKNVEDYLIKYFIGEEGNNFNDLTQYEYDEYEDYYGNFWKFDGGNVVGIYTTANKEVRNDIKEIPNLIKKYFKTITEIVDLYVNKIGDKIVKLPGSYDEAYNMTRS